MPSFGQRKAITLSSASQDGSSKRRSGRWSTTLPALLSVPGTKLVLDCKVLDMSAQGARLAVQDRQGRFRDTATLPDGLVVTLPTDRVEVSAVVRWRNGDQIGVRFTSPFNKIRNGSAGNGRGDGLPPAHLWMANRRPK